LPWDANHVGGGGSLVLELWSTRATQCFGPKPSSRRDVGKNMLIDIANDTIPKSKLRIVEKTTQSGTTMSAKMRERNVRRHLTLSKDNPLALI